MIGDEMKRTHWTGPDLPPERDVAWGDSMWRDGQLHVRLHRGWVAQADDRPFWRRLLRRRGRTA